MNRVLALVSLMALAGCTVGPDYHLPATAIARNPSAQAPFREGGAQTSAADLPARWWHLYDDSVLDTLEEQALAANKDLAIAGANLAHARAVTEASVAQNEPDLAAQFGAQRARLSGESYLLAEPLPPASLASGGLELSYQLDLFGRIRRTVEAARANEEASAATRDAVRVTVAGDVARAYLTLCAAHKAEDVAGDSLTLARRGASISQRLAAAGRVSRTDVTLAEARVAQAEAQIPTYRAHARAALYRLAYLTGHTPAEAPQAADACRTIPTIASPLPIGNGASLIARRPDIRAAERQLASATARIGIATAELYPDIGFGASAGSTGFLKDFGTGPANDWALGGLIHWSIPGGGARARVNAANADAQAALARFDAAVLGALRESETMLATYAQDHNRLAALTRARIAADRAAGDAKALRAAGKAPLQAYLGGQQNANVARLAELGAEAEMAQDQVSLFLALGGGW